jgi:transposase
LLLNVLIILILDSAKIHKSHASNVSSSGTGDSFEHLTTYSPEYNPIKRFWQWLKAKVYGASAFETIEEVIAKIRKLTWHYREGWLKTIIQFDFVLYAKIL